MHSARRIYLGDMATRDDRKRFQRLVRTVEKRGAIITTHDAPDADGVAGAFVLLKHFPGKVDIVTGKTLHLTDPLVERVRIPLKKWSEIPESDDRPLIVVDTSTSAMLTRAAHRKNSILAVIDHHEIKTGHLNAQFVIRNPNAISVCEIVASLIPKSEIDADSALALAVGIACDSEKLEEIDDKTLSIFQTLIRRSNEQKPVIDALAFPPLAPEVLVALLEDMKRLQTEVYRGKVIAVGPCSHEIPATLAITLKDMKVNVVASLHEEQGGEYRISFRVRYADASKGGIHASDIALKASQRCGMPQGMWGGGHIDKAGAIIRGTYESIATAIVESAREVIDRALGSK